MDHALDLLVGGIVFLAGYVVGAVVLVGTRAFSEGGARRRRREDEERRSRSLERWMGL